MKLVFVIIGWILLINAIATVYFYFAFGKVYTKWGVVIGDEAIFPMVGHILVGLIFGIYSVRETASFLRKRK